MEEHLLPFLNNKDELLIFQHDGAPCHTAKTIKKFFTEKGIEILDWASQSPDLNPIEHVWAIIKRILGNQKFSNFDELKREILKIWNNEITP